MRGFEFVISKHKKHQYETLMPIRKTQYSAGYDFLAPYNIKLKPKEQKLIWTDIKSYMQYNEVLIIQIRSSLGIKQGISLANGFGVIDSDYYSNIGNDGNIGICLKNNSKDTITIEKGEGIAQGIFLNYLIANNCNSNDNNRIGGFGSTNENTTSNEKN